MWCPKCRNEYINGVTTCVDCGCDLVEELPEEIDENEPVAIGSLAKEETAAKLVSYLNRAGLLSCAVRPQPENEEGEIPAYDIIVAGKELVYIHQLFDGLTEDADDDENPDLELLLPKFEEKYAEIQDEEANKLLLRPSYGSPVPFMSIKKIPIRTLNSAESVLSCLLSLVIFLHS